MASSARPKVEQAGDVRIIRFTGDKNARLDDVLAAELAGCTDDLENRHLLLDFTNIVRIHSIELGTLINLHKKLAAAGGRLTLFNVSPLVFEVFTVTRLETLLAICREGQNAPV